MNMRNLIIGLIVLVAIGGVYLARGGSNPLSPKPTPTPNLLLGDLENLITASGTLVPARRANLAFQVQGQAVKVAVKVGDQVKAGDVLIKLEAAEEESALKGAQAALQQLKAGATKEEIAVAQANVDTARAQLARARVVSTAEEIAIAKASLERAAAMLRDAQSAYDRVRGDPQVGMLPQSQALHLATQDYRIAEARYQQSVKGPLVEEVRIAETSVVSAQAALERVKASARPEEIAGAQARVEQAQAVLSSTSLVAPFAGTIVAINVREGEMVAPHVPVLTLGDLSGLRLETDDLSETNIARVQLGQMANTTFEALPGKTFKGKVTHIAPISSAKQGGTNYTIYIQLDGLDPVLRWGMTGHIEINTRQ